MKIGKMAAVQCMAVAAVLAAEIIYAVSSHTAGYSVEEDGSSIGAEHAESGFPEISAVSDFPEDRKDSASGLQREEKKEETVPGPDMQKKPVEAAKLTWEEVPVELTDREFTFGAMHVALPEKSTWEYETREDGTASVCLSAADKPSFLKEMYFTHYRVTWEDTWELKLAALEMTGLNEAEWFFCLEEEKPINRTFGIEMTDEENRKNYYVLVQEEDLYLLEDNDTERYKIRFGDGQEDNLTWDDIGGFIARETGYSLYRLGGRNNAFLEEYRPWSGDGFVFLYQNGDFEKPAQIFGGNVGVHEDINFDGCYDIATYDKEKEERKYLLWSEAEGHFVESVVPQDEYFSFRIGQDMLEEFGTIWEYDFEWNEDTWEERSATEKLYRWEGTVLKEKRRIISEIKEEEVFVELTVPENGECIASGTFPREGWQKDPQVRKLYEQFYEGYAPQEYYYTFHVAPGKEKCIPDSLADSLSRALTEGSESAFLNAVKGAEKLSDEEMEEAGLHCAEIADLLWEREEYSGMSIEMVQADLDNDGVEDIYAAVYSGGSGGFTDYTLYRGIEGGGYRETGHGSGTYWNPFMVVCWNGKNYICRSEQDYNKKIKNRLVLEGYRDGKMVEAVFLSFVQGRTEISVQSCEEGYQESAEKERARAEENFEQTEAFREVVGDVEQRVGSITFRGDVDNDGTAEVYRKYIWLPSNMGTVSILEFEMVEEAEEKTPETAIHQAIFENIEKRGIPIMFWIDRQGAENIVNVMYRTDLYDYVIEGYLPKDTGDYESLYLIEKSSKRAVETIRAGQNTRRWHEIT